MKQLSGIFALVAIMGFVFVSCSGSGGTGDGLPALTGTVRISGTPNVGQLLWADTTNLGGSGTISYRWKRGGNVVGNDENYYVQSEDIGYTITVTVTRSGYSGSVTSNPTAHVTNLEFPPLTGTVIIGGTAAVGETLSIVSISPNVGGDFFYQWNRDGTPIPYSYGYGYDIYVVQPDDVGFTITVTLTLYGYSGGITSEPTATVTDPRPPLTGTVIIDGRALVGDSLTANTDNLNGSGYFYYQWKRGEDVIFGYDYGYGYGYGYSDYYYVDDLDIGYTITVTVTCEGNSGSVTSDPTDLVSIPVFSGEVIIKGYTEAGQTLTLDTSDLNISGYGLDWLSSYWLSYQWKRNSTSSETTSDIGTSSTYLVKTDDEGYFITVTVTHPNYTEIITSAAVGPVTLPGTPTLSSITFAQITDDAPSIPGFTLYRVSNGGPTSVTLTVDYPEQYDSISWRVQGTDVTGTGESFILSAADPAYNLIGEHFVTVLVFKDGVPYNKTVSFKIEY